MQKISFDAEDFPPPSYYYGNALGDDPSDKNKKDKLPSAFHDPKLDTAIITQQPTSPNLATNLAPVHQSAKSGTSSKDEKDKSGFDKSEWWKAPEFVPRNLTVQMSVNGSYVTQQQQSAASQHSTNFVSGLASKDLTASSSPITHHQSALQTPQLSKLNSKTTPHMTAPFPIAMPPTGLGPGPTPAFIPLPLPTPGAHAGWPLNTAASIAALHNQLARVYAHNPRVIRGQHASSTAYHNQKLQQLILQQQNQFQHQHHHHPFVPNMGPLRTPHASSGQGIPTGYTANMTTIDAGLGRSIPAIVLKRKRKKKNKKATAMVNDSKQQQQMQQIAKSGEKQENPGDGSTKIDRQDSSKRESEEEDDDETTASSLNSAPLAETRRSEPDLTKMQHDSNSNSAMCDVLIGTANEHLGQQSCYYPNDLDLIQNANHCVMITGSCPDLSADMMEDSKSDEKSSMTISHHVNPFDDNPDQTIGNYFIAREKNFTQSAYGADEFELDTNPVVRNAMRDLASDGMIKSKQVKDLNRQIVKDMNLEEKMSKWKDEEWSEPELDEDDTIFERLLKNEDDRQKTAKKKQFETNPGKGQKSLREELEEGLMVFRNRGTRDYGLLPQRDEDALDRKNPADCTSRAMVHHTAIVHGSKKHGEMAITELFNGQEDSNTDSMKRSKKNSIIPRATYVEEDMEDEERMRITVNALDALDVDGADTFLAKSHLRSMAASTTNHHRSAEDVSATSKRYFKFSESVPLVPFVRSRNCCVLM